LSKENIPDDTCTLKPKLSATTGTNGGFEIGDVPAGEYAILYHPEGPKWTGIKGLVLDVSEKSSRCLAEMMLGSPSRDCGNATPYFGDGGLTIQSASIAIEGGGATAINSGSLISDKYQLYLDIEDRQPPRVTVKAGKVTNVDLKLWDE